ncbi:MAG: PVC-type heme-binding CxxCH protein [Limisphaerales bacterium]
MKSFLSVSPLAVLVALCAAVLNTSAAEPTLHSFKKQQLDKHYWSEGAMLGDLNKDGKPDAISGPYWWEGPAFTKRHEIYPATRTTKTKNLKGAEVEFPGFEGNFGSRNAYSTDNFFAFVHDFNGDGWNDVLTYGLPNTPAFLYLNPKGKEQHWERSTVLDHVDNESPTFVDLTGDGKPEIVCNYEGNYGYASPDWSNPTAKWKFTPITAGGKWQRFTHGLGVGDVNGDGKLDLLCKDGWFEQPKSLAGDPAWKHHKTNFAPASAQMYAYDVNGDGRADIITALAAHGYGLAWHEQLAEKDDNGSPKWRSHVFMHKAAEENRYGVHFPELHAVELFDVDGDGLKDIITGNCYWAHGPAVAPGAGEEGVLYWFKLVRRADKSVDWVPHLIDTASGVGRQIGVADVNGDGKRDLIIGNKMGTFVFTHEAKPVSADAFAKAQPPVKFPAFTDQPMDKMSIIVHTTRPSGTPAVVQPPGGKGDKAAPAKKAKAAAPVQLAAADVKANPPLSAKGVLPVGLDGKPLNTDFETGDLRDWTATGEAFKQQPILGDTVVARRAPNQSAHVGKYWIGTYERGLGDEATGTLTSKPFRLTHRYAAFLVAAGPYTSTRVELVNTGNGNVIFSTPGGDPEKFKETNNSTETLAPVVADLERHQNKEIFIRVVDEQAGGHWGHLNFDDFKLYDERPVFANELKMSVKALAALAQKTAPKAPAPPPAPLDEVKHAGLPPDEAVKAMTLPPGFKVTVFAAEPDVKQPIAFCIDDRGRLWVIENYTYPIRKPGEKGDDRIVVFEDTDGDGKHDKRTVFIEGLNLASGIEWGFGGVFVGAAPWLLHIPVKETATGPQPAGEPKKLLEGFAWHDTHEMLNTFTWGPDGWLYGCHGVFTHSHVKVAGAPDSERQFINAGVWRYQPVKKRFEVFAEGTSNPWGIDFNEYGHCFIEACVIPHLFHMIQGGRYHRQAGQHYSPNFEEARRLVPDYFKQSFSPQAGQPENSYTFKDAKVQPINPFIYDDLKTIADHRHFLGATPHGGNARSDAAGGGHAHAGLMCYLGGTWPKEYHGKLFMGNIHGQRLNVDSPERKGSGYVGRHAPDFLNFNDRASQTLNQMIDQDGNVFVIDWYDRQQCHNQRDPSVHDRSNGRIYKIVYEGAPKITAPSFTSLSQTQLCWRAMGSQVAWHSRHARRLLQEFAAANQLEPKVKETLWGMVNLPSKPATLRGENKKLQTSSLNEREQLQALWALHSVGLLGASEAVQALTHQAEHVRAWTIQLLCEDHKPGDAALKEFARLAKEDPSPVVRLYLASACQRLTVAERAPIVEALLAHAEDAPDHNLPLMYWYATEPIVAADPAKGALLLAKAKIPLLREYITRRLTAK